MHRIDTIQGLNQVRQQLSGSVGFVPTMGALHRGHLSLIEASKKHNEHTVVSIFVNPTQFNQADDLAQYPNTLTQDLEQIQSLGVDAVFLPDFTIMYPDNYAYQLHENDLSQQYCGSHRPGHFNGVLTVVMKLFNLVKPTRAYLGEKDYQQLNLIAGMVQAFFMDVEIVACPIVRESDGLAMSSRNLRLSPAQRKIAPLLYATLVEDSNLQDKQQKLSALGFEVDYIEVMNNRLLAAASLGEIRLIDNVPYGVEQ